MPADPSPASPSGGPPTPGTAKGQRPWILESAFGERGMRWFTRWNVRLYRATSGRVLGRFRGAPVLLLTTTGRKSGQPRTQPLIYVRDDAGTGAVLVASKGGAPEHPLWYRNLAANPRVEVQIGGDCRPMTARTATPAERAAYWPRLTAVYADYDAYQRWTDREIPLVILEP